MFNWLNRETRQADYSDQVAALLEATSEGLRGNADWIAAREIALGLWGRAFASAQVTPTDGYVEAALTPSVLEMIGREVIAKGEVLFLIEVENGQLRLSPASDWTVAGGPDPASWTYALTRAGPSRSYTRKSVPASSVVHIRYGVESREPWHGVGPLEHASTTATLAANVEARLAEELGQSAGSLLPVPDGKKKADLQSDLRNIKGRLALVDSTASGWGEGSQGAPKRDLMQMRIGANPPEVLSILRSEAALSVLASCGVPISVLSKADGTALRESWRQFLHASVIPVSLNVASELTAKLDTNVSLSFDRMFASDLSGRARAFQSMVGGGMDVTKAAALAGLMEADQ